MFKFNESTLPAQYSASMLQRKDPMDVDATHVHKMYEILFKSAATFLSLVRAQAKKVALSIEDANGNMSMAFVLTDHENEDPEMPGNYTLEITLDKADIADAKVYTIQDHTFLQNACTTAHSLHGILFNLETYIIELFTAAANNLIEWLDANANPAQENGIELEGYFVAKVVVENGEKLFAITPGGEIKQQIKDDTAKQV